MLVWEFLIYWTSKLKTLLGLATGNKHLTKRSSHESVELLHSSWDRETLSWLGRLVFKCTIYFLLPIRKCGSLAHEKMRHCGGDVLTTLQTAPRHFLVELGCGGGQLVWNCNDISFHSCWDWRHFSWWVVLRYKWASQNHNKTAMRRFSLGGLK